MHCTLEEDRKFATKRMALLYVAKMNSDSVLAYMAESGKRWTDLCPSVGPYAVTPNRPFSPERFLELSDDILEEYGSGVGNALNRHKAPEGTIYRYRAVSINVTDADELHQLLFTEVPEPS